MIHRGATNSGGKGSTWPPCRPRAFPSETRRCYIAMTYMTSWHGSHGPIAHMAMPAPCHCSIGTGRSSGDRGSDFPMTCASFGLPASRLESARVKGWKWSWNVLKHPHDYVLKMRGGVPIHYGFVWVIIFEWFAICLNSKIIQNLLISTNT